MKCALVGCGYWGEKVLSALCKPQESRDLGVLEPYGKGVLHSAEFELVGVYDSHLDNAQKARESCPSVHIYPSFEALLADRQIQAVFIITPPASHFALAKAALEAKKHIFVEKPLALSSKECALLYELAARQGVVVHCDHIFLYAPAVQWLKAHIHELGEICSIHARRESLGRLQKEVSVVWDLALHDIAILDYVLGAGVLEQMKPSARVVEAGGYRAVADIGLVDTRTTIAIHTSWLSPTKVREMVIVGRSGRGVVYDEVADPKLAMFAMDSALFGEDSALRDKAGSLWLASSIDTQVLSPCSPLHNPAFSSQILESTFESPTAKRSFFRKQATAVQGGGTQTGFFRAPRILEEEKGAGCEKSAANQKVDSSNEAFLSSLRADLSAWQSTQTKTQILESTFDKNAKLQKKDSSPNAHFSVIASRDSGVAIHKGAKVDSSKQPQDSRIFDKTAQSVFDSHAAGGRIVDTNAELQKADSSKQPKDSRILEIESGLFKRVQRRILGVCNCSTRAEIADSSPKPAAAVQGEAEAGFFRKAESTKQKPTPESSQAKLPTTPPLISSIAHFYAQITQGQICQELASHTLRVVQILEQIDVATLR